MTVWWEISCVALGGAIGAVSRYVVAVLTVRWFGESFPFGTLIVNVLGCFLLGLIGEYKIERQAIPPYLYSGLAAGFLGALTTFSTFGFETLRRAEANQWWIAGANIVANLAVGLLAVWLGINLARAIIPEP